MDILVTVDGLKKSFGVHDIFQNVSFTVRQGEKVGLVGVNGSGKTTLLRCLLDPDFADGGSVKFAGDLRLGYVEQGFDDFREETVWQFMQHACPDILNLREKMRQLEEASGRAQGEELQGILDQYARTESRYAHLDGYHYENNIKRVLIGLGYPEETWQWRADKLSGGQKTRLQLAAALVNSPDLLILDEPTNHLDIAMKEVIEEAMQSFTGTLLFVSHDRYLLDKVADHILELKADGAVTYQGGFQKWLEAQQKQPEPEETPAAKTAASGGKPAEKPAYRSKKQRAQQAKMRADLRSLEQQLDKMQEELDTLTAELTDEAVCSDYQLMQEKCQRMEELRVQMDETMEQMILLEEELG